MGSAVESSVVASATSVRKLQPRAVLELLKPITWFPPMWAFGCGAVSVGPPEASVGVAVAGVLLAGPFVCATSQAVNDWFDRHVDAINEPHRPIPSGRLPGATGLYVAIIWTALSIVLAAALGQVVFVAALLGLVLAWLYSAPPVRLKRNGWVGNAAVGFCYESLPWITGAAVMAGGAVPDARNIAIALLYGLGAHGIMTLNDFKSIEGDRQIGIGSLPARLGARAAARFACAFMALPQIAVIGLLVAWGLNGYALIVALSLAAQGVCMVRLLRDPRAFAPWYNATGVTLYVTGMLVCAFALRSLVGTPGVAS